MSREYDIGGGNRLILPERSEDAISEALRYLTEVICVNKIGDDHDGAGGLGGSYGYGVDYENDTFMIHRFCWCDEDTCLWCTGQEPNFRHKPSGATVTWYKWIGRSMEFEGSLPADFLQDCIRSLAVKP